MCGSKIQELGELDGQVPNESGDIRIDIVPLDQRVLLPDQDLLIAVVFADSAAGGRLRSRDPPFWFRLNQSETLQEFRDRLKGVVEASDCTFANCNLVFGREWDEIAKAEVLENGRPWDVYHELTFPKEFTLFLVMGRVLPGEESLKIGN
jgi:hypothetical protein